MIRSRDIIPPHVFHLIRRATPADIPAIDRIERESFVDPWEMSVFAEALGYFPSTYFVALCGDQIAGFVIGAMEDTGENICGHLSNFAVGKDFLHCGIGTSLMRRIEQQFKLEGAAGSQLEVRVSNLPAQRFYAKLRYRPVITIANYYSNGEDAIVMMKWFRF